ncbi:MAG: hypothetical protein ACRDHW_00215 [Ktedonobacteraceae bacterium]
MAVLIGERSPVCVGIDIGQVQDPAAICVSEVDARPTGKHRYIQPVPAHVDERGRWILPVDTDPIMTSHYTVRHIARLPLGTSYPDVADIIANMLCSPLLIGRSVRVLMDITGVGRGVYDILRVEISRRKEARSILLKPISFVHGEAYNQKTGILGKGFLVSRLQSLLQGLRVHAPDTPEMQAALDELKIYARKMSQNGTDTYGAFKTGEHDDLATALGLSVLEDPFGEKVRYSSRVY